MNRHVRKVGRVFSAGAFGAVRAATILMVIVLVGIPLVQGLLQWNARDRFAVLPFVRARPASSSGPVINDATIEETSRIEDALSDMRYPVRLDDVTIVVSAEPCPDCAGEYLSGRGIIRLERAVVGVGGYELHHALAHEIGHYVDETYLDDSQRARFRTLRGIPPDSSWIAPNLPWEERPVEDFAEVFATLDVPSAVQPPLTTYGRVSNPVAIDRLFRAAGLHTLRSAPARNWRKAVGLELDFIAATLSHPGVFVPVAVLILFGSVVGGLGAMWGEIRQTY